MRDACWALAAQGPNDESTQPQERIDQLIDSDPAGFLEHLEALVAETGTTDNATYLYQGGLAALSQRGAEVEVALREACYRSQRFAHVAYTALEFGDRALLHRVLDRELVVRTWVAYQQLHNTDADEFWAWEAVSDACNDSHDEHWSLILDLLNASPDDAVVAMVGVGPIEDWIGGGWEEGVQRIEAEARRNPRLRQALDGIWIDGIPEEFFARIERAANTKLPRMKR
jgi:hypothetical protein